MTNEVRQKTTEATCAKSRRWFAFIAQGILLLGVMLSWGELTAETEVTWANNAGDYDLSNPENYGGVNPVNPSYKVKITVSTTEANPYCMKYAASLLTRQITLAPTTAMVLDLGTDRSFLAAYRVNFNSEKTVLLKSGLFGIDWSSSDGERFFMGDNTADGGTINVSGSDAILSSSYKNSIQVGVGKSNYRLNVKDGATLKANLAVSVSGGSGNKVFIEGANTKHFVPSDSTQSPLILGNTGSGNVYMLTNHAALVSETSAQPIIIGNMKASKDVIGTGSMYVLDGSSVRHGEGLRVGNVSSGNLLEVSGGSSVNVDGALSIGGDHSLATSATTIPTCGNVVRVSGEGTVLSVGNSSALVVGALNGSHDNKLHADDGAMVRAGAGLSIGNGICTTNNTVVFESGAVLDVAGTVQIGTDSTSGYNSFVLDGANIYQTGNVEAVYFDVGKYSPGNLFEAKNGSHIILSNSYFRIGWAGAGSCSNRVKIVGGSSLKVYAKTFKDDFFIGQRGCWNELTVDSSTLDFDSSLMRMGGANTATENALRLKNGAVANGYRIIMSEVAGSDHHLVEIDGSTLTLSDNLQMGATGVYGNKLILKGSSAKLSVGKLDLGADGKVRFVLAGATSDVAMVSCSAGLTCHASVAADHPTTIAVELPEGGTFEGQRTLFECPEGKKLDFGEHVIWDYDASCLTLKVTERKVTVKRKSGLILVVR